jgi:hypothetical protein
MPIQRERYPKDLSENEPQDLRKWHSVDALTCIQMSTLKALGLGFFASPEEESGRAIAYVAHCPYGQSHSSGRKL